MPTGLKQCVLRLAGLMTLALSTAVLLTGAASAQSQPPSPTVAKLPARPLAKPRPVRPRPVAAPGVLQPPAANIRTNIIQIAPPAGWVSSNYRTNMVDELGEFIPVGQDAATSADRLGFTSNILPRAGRLTPVNKATDFMLANQRKQCRDSAVRTFSPATPRVGWYSAQFYCIGRIGVAPDLVEVTYFAQAIRGDSLFSVWRAWRGTAVPLKAMLKVRTGLDVDLVQTSTKAGRLDEKVIDRITPLLLQAFAPDLARAELCDLAAGEICDSFRTRAVVPPSLIALFDVQGSGELTPAQAATLAANGQTTGFYADLARKLAADPTARATMLQSITLANHDWNSAASMQAALRTPLLGARAAGGTLTAMETVPPADAALRARMQAYIVFLSRFAWKLGIAPERETVILTPCCIQPAH